MRIPVPQPSARWAAAATLALLAACADQPTAPAARTPSAGMPAFTVSPSGAALVSNRVKYSDTGQRASTGRAGSAAVTALALVGRDMATELTLRAAPADTNRTAQAQLQKVKVTATGYDSAQVFETNYTGLSGSTFTRTYPGLGWGQTLQVQANVSGIDPNRTDVVNATVPVLLRPDLNVFLWITSGTRVRLGEPYTVTAYVGEGNGQVGARADCVLYVDGVAEDRALGIWVDASGFVTCAFTHVFQTEGRKHLEVRVENVSPGDWDTANNASGGTVTVVARDNYFEQAIAWSDTSYTQSYFSHDYIDHRYGFGNQTVSEYVNDRWSQFALAYGGFDRGLSGPLTIHASQSTGGRTVHDLTLRVDSLGVGYQCFSRVDDSAAATFYACTINSPYFQSTTFRYDRNAGAVTYHSADYGAWWDGAGSEVYTYHFNYDFSNAFGVRVPYGTDYTFSLQFVTPDSTYSTSLTFPLTYTQYDAGGPETSCGQYSDADYFIRTCHAFETHSSSLAGEWPGP
jgi:hypothetical protein